MHCNNHSYFHSECAACHHVRSTHEDSTLDQTYDSTNWLSTYTSSLPDSSSYSSPDTSSSSSSDSSFSGFDGGSSGGGGTSGDY